MIIPMCVFDELVRMTCINVSLFFSPTLTWRDMQHIVLMSSRTEPLRDAYWIINGVGRKGKLCLYDTMRKYLTSAVKLDK